MGKLSGVVKTIDNIRKQRKKLEAYHGTPHEAGISSGFVRAAANVDRLKDAAKKANLDPSRITVRDDGLVQYPEEYINPLSEVGAGGVRREVAIHNDAVLGTDTKSDYDTEAMFVHDPSYRYNNPDSEKPIKEIRVGKDTAFDGLFTQGRTDFIDEDVTNNTFFVKKHADHYEFIDALDDSNKFEELATKHNLDLGKLDEDQISQLRDLVEERTQLEDYINFDNGEYELPEWLSNAIGVSDPGDASWELQRVRGRIAADLGFDAVDMYDETGTSSLVLGGRNVRNVNAAFDPQFKDSSNLLGFADPALLTGMAGTTAAGVAAPLAYNYAKDEITDKQRQISQRQPLDMQDARQRSYDRQQGIVSQFTQDRKATTGGRAARAKKMFLKKRADQGSTTALEKIAALGEAGLTIGSGMANEAYAGGMGIAAGLDPRLPKGTAAQVVREVQGDAPLQYVPKSELGMDYIVETAETLDDLGEAYQQKAQETGFDPVRNFNKSADYLGEEVHPAAGTVLKVLPDTIL